MHARTEVDIEQILPSDQGQVPNARNTKLIHKTFTKSWQGSVVKPTPYCLEL